MRNKTSTCLNCGQQIADMNYCPECGQANTSKRISLRQLFSDFFGDYFTFDSKIFRSLLPLVFKPGFLTREYTEGKRNAYILPFRLYIFVTFIFFLVLAVSHQVDGSESTPVISPSTGEAMSDSLTLILKDYPEIIPFDISGEIIAKFDTAFYQFMTENQSENRLVLTDDDTTDVNSDLHFNIESKDTSTISGKFMALIEKKAESVASQGRAGEQMLIDGMINQLPKIFFLLLPVFALLLKILYFRRKLFYVEHLIFSLHWHTFVFLMFIALGFFSNGWIFLGILLLSTLYLFMAMRHYYQQSVFKTLVKMMILMPVYFFCVAGAGIVLIFSAIIIAG
ncbi:MAG: DUF3667 domain-containing protein [Candidatus Marinimicrobia bacterium]|nr:DUF3667 domain-containing protein [Candidatus Neomarinimicrobiota bacterium]